jgi:hypothetical protein
LSSLRTAWNAKGTSDPDFEFGVEALDRVVLKTPEFVTGVATGRDLLPDLATGFRMHQLDPSRANGPAVSPRPARDRTPMGPNSRRSGFDHLPSIERPPLLLSPHIVSQAVGPLLGVPLVPFQDTLKLGSGPLVSQDIRLPETIRNQRVLTLRLTQH